MNSTDSNLESIATNFTYNKSHSNRTTAENSFARLRRHLSHTHSLTYQIRGALVRPDRDRHRVHTHCARARVRGKSHLHRGHRIRGVITRHLDAEADVARPRSKSRHRPAAKSHAPARVSRRTQERGRELRSYTFGGNNVPSSRSG